MIQLFKPHVSEEAIAAVVEVLRSGWIGLGPKTAEFEQEFARYVGAKYASAMNSATSALHLAMIAAGVKPGDEVLTTALTFVSTNHAIEYVGASPVFVDVDGSTLNLDLTKAERLITPATKAIITVHYGGNPCDLDALYAFAGKHKLAVIEDAAHACGAAFKGKKIGSFPGLTTFSFHAVKNLPMGDGGMITTNDEAVYHRLQKLRWLGIDRSTFERLAGGYQWEYDVTEVGFKYHMNDINAAMGLAHLKQLDAWNARRSEIVEMYRSQLQPCVKDGRLAFVERTAGAESANHLCVIRVKARDQVVDQLKARGVSVGVHYRPNHLYKVYQDSKRGDLGETEKAYREIVTLPLHMDLSDADVLTVCAAIDEVTRKEMT